MRDVEDEAYWKKKTLEHLGVEVDGDDGEADLHRRAESSGSTKDRVLRCYVCDRQSENGYFLSRASVRVCMKCCRAQGIEQAAPTPKVLLPTDVGVTLNGRPWQYPNISLKP